MVFADSRGRRTGITALVIERDVVPVDTKSVNQGEVESIAKRTGTTTLAGTITQSPFQEVYLFNCTLGCGAHGRVYLAQEKCTETFFAIKVLTKRSQYSSPGGYDRAVTEKECMRLAMEEALPFVMPLIRAWDENENVFMVMPLCPETLLDRLSRETAKTINRRLLAAELLLALKDLHDRHIVHRDLKPENVFLTFGGHIRLGDLGLVYVVEEELSSTEFYDYEIFEGLNGTIGYLAPELLDPDYADQPYTPKVDIYSMGLVLLQVFLWKDYPYFEAYTLQGQWRRMQDDQQRWRKRIPDENAVDLLSQMLCPDPRARPTVDELLYHPFFMGHHATSQVGDHESHPAVGGPPTKGFKWKAVYDCQYPCADMYPFQGPQFDSPTVSDDSAEDAISDAQRAECMHQEREKERASRKGRLQSEFTYGCERGWETDPRHGTFTSTWIPKSMWMDGEVVLIEDDASA
ncbi:hypothetical protein CERSUDRAFT_75828 [Gelatoporia subvermispora B]|uniref:Protein kinase domain-containing protein n=1 Tax=Ceriporiopsis subvermispora (strain B) TaxID=914234 RepID=M2QB69_CERS8|nr:hypothetical protein CERSUDRAFT_75828 [Gelatoporia subvermispora B]